LADPQNGGFFSTASDGEALIARRRDLEDSPISRRRLHAAAGLLRLAQLTGDERYERHAASVLALLSEIAPRHPAGLRSPAAGHALVSLARAADRLRRSGARA